ncbi:uncharacterized protein LOC125375922 [Haliotis rufescens]|uniref:uncharacterized protein LOC125375922 n=1 Tax=Haliotis rufescens TaxID=6454 RepID=UPI00201F2992|nr:uncharacterized protein LOC125375922 [Haliotis rufescens]
MNSNDRSIWYLETNNLLSDIQCGFRKKTRSTIDYLVVEEAKYLGLIFDRHLTFLPHIKYIKAKCLKDLDFKFRMKHSLILKDFLLSVLTIFTFHLAQSDTAVIHCPDIAYLGTSAQITCSTSDNFTNTIYKCPCGVAPQCPVSYCTNVSGQSANIVNQTQTELTIISVQPRHSGNWSCADGGDVGTTFCLLVVAKIPSVNITSDVDADSVNLGDRISLTVDIRDYHCSDAYSLTLQIGSVTYTCETGWNATVENLTETVPINVTQIHFGVVKLVFVCGNHQWNITSGGVNELQQNKTNVQTTIDTPTPPDDSKLLIVAAGASPAVGVIIIITIVCCCYRRRKQVNPTEKHEPNLPFDPPYISVGGPTGTAYSDVDVSIQDFRRSNTAKGSPRSAVTRCSNGTLRDGGDVHEATGKDDGSQLGAEGNIHAGVIVQLIVPDVDELYARVNKTKNTAERNNDTAL